ncbi:MAG: hypothetical protein WCE81_08805 [Halobacteriota archaeon]
MNKCIALLFVSIIVLAPVFVSGCMSQRNQNATNTTTNQTATSTTATSNQTLKTMVETLHDIIAENSTAIKAWKITWIDANTVRIDYATDRYNASENTTVHTNGDYTIKQFDTVNDAATYLDSQVSGYKLDLTVPPNDSAYIRAIGHEPSTYERWTKINELRSDHYDVNAIVQSDNFIISLNEVAYRYAGRIT